MLAAFLLVRIDEPALSEVTIRVLAAHLSAGNGDLRRQAVLRLPATLERTHSLVQPLSSLASGQPSQESLRAADILGRWAAMGPGELIPIYATGLRSVDGATLDCALESPVLPTLESEQLASLVFQRLTDAEQSLAWCPESPVCEGGFERRHAAIVVLSRMPESMRRWVRRAHGPSIQLPAADEPLLRLSLEGADSLSASESRVMLDEASSSRTWAAVRMLIDQGALVGELALPAAQLAFRASHRSSLFRMLGRWLQGLPEKTLRQLVVADGTEYFKWRVQRVTSLDLEDR